LPPDNDTRGKGEQDREASQYQSAGERRKRRYNLKRAGAYNNDSDESRRERK